MKSGRIIVLSGLDAAGKTTQAKFILQQLENENISHRHIPVRFGWTAGVRKLREVMKTSVKTLANEVDNQNKREPKKKKTISLSQKLFRLVAMLDLARTFLIVRWERWRGRVVVCNRGQWDNFIILKEKFEDIDPHNWWQWKLVQWCARKPDLTILITIPAELAYHRILTNRGTVQEDLTTLHRRAKLYDDITEKAGWFVVSATQPSDELSRIIWEQIRQRLPS
jgi:thymidylate kinase